MRILVVTSEDWFVLSHFRPLLAQLTLLTKDVVVVARCSGRLHEIGQLGVRTRSFDMKRGSLNVALLRNARDGLARIIDEERPDVVHAIAMQTMVMTSVALAKAQHRPPTVIMHLVGLGYLGYSRSPIAHILRPLAFAAIRRSVLKYNTWLLAENTDDLNKMAAHGAAAPGRTAIVPGAGVDPELLPELPTPANAIPHVAFVGRMVFSKGLETLVKAHQRLLQRGIVLELGLFGAADRGSRDAIPKGSLSAWSSLPHIKWHGHTDDVVSVWREADIAVLPSLVGEGMPRSMLEAGSCGRPLVVSDVSGCRDFVRDGVEGLLARPNDSTALGHALGHLAVDARLRLKLGAAARRRVLEQFSDHRVRNRIRETYEAALAGR
jgi:glycosyltransferase involved in cell wall biosynthesis